MSNHIENYIFDNCNLLGKGATSYVYKAVDTRDNCEYAIKEFKNNINPELIDREIEACKKLSQHENLVQLKECLRKKYLIMEYCNAGALYNMIELNNGLSDDWILLIVRCLARSVKFMTRNDYIHRDIKPNNILCHIDTHGRLELKLADLGSSLHIQPADDAQSPSPPAPLPHPHDAKKHGTSKGATKSKTPHVNSNLGVPTKNNVAGTIIKDSQKDAYFTTLCGTPGFLHPNMQSELDRLDYEAHQNKRMFSVRSDLWSIAITLYHAICNTLPFLPQHAEKLDKLTCYRVMNELYKSRNVHQISGRKNMETNKVMWQTTLLVARGQTEGSCKLSATLRPHLERLILGLMNQQQAWEYDQYFMESERILQLCRVPVFNMNSGELELVYMQCNRSVLTLADLIVAIDSRWGLTQQDDGKMISTGCSGYYLMHPSHGLLAFPECTKVAITYGDASSSRTNAPSNSTAENNTTVLLNAAADLQLHSISQGQSDLQLADLTMLDTFYLLVNSSVMSFEASPNATSNYYAQQQLPPEDKLFKRDGDNGGSSGSDKRTLEHSSNALRNVQTAIYSFEHLHAQRLAYRTGIDLFYRHVMRAVYALPLDRIAATLERLVYVFEHRLDGEKTTQTQQALHQVDNEHQDDLADLLFRIQYELADIRVTAKVCTDSMQGRLASMHHAIMTCNGGGADDMLTDSVASLQTTRASAKHILHTARKLFNELHLISIKQSATSDNIELDILPRMKNFVFLYKEARVIMFNEKQNLDQLQKRANDFCKEAIHLINERIIPIFGRQLTDIIEKRFKQLKTQLKSQFLKKMECHLECALELIRIL